jgi:HAD superfamily hydrolase (TIGR01490 family)
MAKLVFCDVEGTLLTASFPGLFMAQGRQMDLFTRQQLFQAGALVASARALPGKLGQMARMAGFIRATAGCSEIDVERVLDATMPQVLAHLKPAMIERLQAHQRDGYDLILLSAGLHPGIVRLAQALGGRGEGTKVRVRAGRYTAALDGPACQGSGKALRARQILAELHADPAGCYAYGDTAGDIPFLTLFGHPHAVDPDPQLARTAQRLGWPVLYGNAKEVAV